MTHSAANTASQGTVNCVVATADEERDLACLFGEVHRYVCLLVTHSEADLAVTPAIRKITDQWIKHMRAVLNPDKLQCWTSDKRLTKARR